MVPYSSSFNGLCCNSVLSKSLVHPLTCLCCELASKLQYRKDVYDELRLAKTDCKMLILSGAFSVHVPTPTNTKRYKMQGTFDRKL